MRGKLGKKFNADDYEPKRAYLAGSIKEVINTFGIESILIHSAMLLKRRIFVYCSDAQRLISVVRVIPQFVVERQDWDVARPWVHLEEEELEDLNSNPHFVAGFTQEDAEERTDLYDLFVNVDAGSITVAEHAQEAFGLGKIHKDIAMSMVDAAADEEISNVAVVKDIGRRTQELLGGLEKLADEETGKVTVAAIRARKMGTAMQVYLYNLAKAEGCLDESL